MTAPDIRIARRFLSDEEDAVEHYRGDKKIEDGVERRDAAGAYVKAGLWKAYGELEEHQRENWYEAGVLVASNPNVVPVLRTLQTADPPDQQYRAMDAAVGGYGAVILALRRLAKEGQGVPSLALAEHLIEICPPLFLSQLAFLFGDLKGAYAGMLTEMAAKLPSRRLDAQGHRVAAAVVLSLWHADPTRVDADVDPLIVAALEGLSFPHISRENATHRLGEMLSALPQERTERLLLQASEFTYYLVSFGWACPTPSVVAALLETIAAWGRGKHDQQPGYRTGALQTLRRLGRPLLQPLLALLQGAGRTSFNRDLFLIVLAEVRVPEAAPVLMLYVCDRMLAARDAARRGIVALGDAAVPALIAASKGPPSATQKWALLTLRSVGAPRRSDEPEGFRALGALRGSTSEEQRTRWATLFLEHERDGQLEHSWMNGVTHLVVAVARAEARRDLRALLFYSEYLLSLCRAGRVFELRLDAFLELCKGYWADSPAVPFLIADLLTSAPKEHFFHKIPEACLGTPQDPAFRRGELIKGYCRTFGEPLAEPLSYMLSIREAEDGVFLQEWLNEM